MEFLNQMNEESFTKPDFQKTWIALKHLRKREWWSRMWVMQEALFAKQLKFHCGKKSADRISFTRLHEIAAKYRGVETRDKSLDAMSMTIATPFDVILMDWDKYKEDLAHEGVRLRKLLVVTTDSLCADPRDKIFALLSMCRKVDRKVLKIDYRASVRWLLTILCKYELIEREIYSPLSLLQTVRRKKNPMLPSWVSDYTSNGDDDKLCVPATEGKVPYQAAANNTAWAALGLASLQPVMVSHFNGMEASFEDEGFFETLVLTGLVVDTIQASFQAAEVEIYEGTDPKEDGERKTLRRQNVVQACREWEEQVQNLPPERDLYTSTCGRDEAFWRTLIADRDLFWNGPPSEAQDFAGRFQAWMGRHHDEKMNTDEDFIRPFNQAAVWRCMRRSFIITKKGYIGLGSRVPRPSDVVCILREGDVPFVLRPRVDEYYELVGEAYIHDIMDGSFVRTATRRQLRQFKIR